MSQIKYKLEKSDIVQTQKKVSRKRVHEKTKACNYNTTMKPTGNKRLQKAHMKKQQEFEDTKIRIELQEPYESKDFYFKDQVNFMSDHHLSTTSNSPFVQAKPVCHKLPIASYSHSKLKQRLSSVMEERSQDDNDKYFDCSIKSFQSNSRKSVSPDQKSSKQLQNPKSVFNKIDYNNISVRKFNLDGCDDSHTFSSQNGSSKQEKLVMRVCLPIFT